MEKTYNAFFYKESNSEYSVVFPDIPYGVTQGETIGNAIDMAKDYLEIALEDFTEKDLPKAMPIEKAYEQQVKENKIYGYNGELIFVMPITTNIKDKCRRINITLSERILKKVDKITNNRSAFINQTLREKLVSYK